MSYGNSWVNADREAFDFPTEEETKWFEAFDESLRHYRCLIKQDICSCGYVGLSELPIQMYPHEGGWVVGGMAQKQWLYVTCPKCKYQWALWKLGVPRE